jgi:transposase
VVIVACLGYSRAGAGADLSKQTPDLLAGISRCLWSLGALPQTLVWDRQAGPHARRRAPDRGVAAFCGRLKVDWHYCKPRDPQAKGVVGATAGLHRAQLRARPGVPRSSSTSSCQLDSETAGFPAVSRGRGDWI